MAFDIVNPGLATTVQDQGRTGHYNVGIPQSGSMDQSPLNPETPWWGRHCTGQAVLERPTSAPSLPPASEAIIAVTGAPVEVRSTGRHGPSGAASSQGRESSSPSGSSRAAPATTSPSRAASTSRGARQRSTYSLGGSGFKGRKLEAGDVVPVGAPSTAERSPTARMLPEEFRPVYAKEQESDRAWAV